MSPKVQEAVDLFEQRFNCSQAIFATYSPEFGVDRETALKVACGFGGGMRMGETCGAVTGAFMVIGLKYGCTEAGDNEQEFRTYEMVKTFAKEFTARNDSVCCKDLLGCDISSDEGVQKAVDEGLFRSVCPKVVRDAAEILEQMIGV